MDGFLIGFKVGGMVPPILDEVPSGKTDQDQEEGPQLEKQEKRHPGQKPPAVAGRCIGKVGQRLP